MVSAVVSGGSGGVGVVTAGRECFRKWGFRRCGCGVGVVTAGRECFRKWGFRRCEDICWVKTNTDNPGNKTYLDHKAIFQNTKEHCLMGQC